MPLESIALRRLAAAHGVQTAYTDGLRKRRVASVDSLLHALRALGAELEGPAGAPDALRAHRDGWWRRLVEPVAVVQYGRRGRVELRLPRSESARLTCRLVYEHGDCTEWGLEAGDLPLLRSAEADGCAYVARRLDLPAELPLGQHVLHLAVGGQRAQTLVLCAPPRAPAVPGREWGVFLPLYALHTESSWGGGDFSDLARLTDWLDEQGGSVVATLPLLSTFLDLPFDPSPYAPVSRLFWNEFYVDVTRAPELAASSRAQEMLASTAVQAEIANLQSASLIDYRRQMALKRRILEVLAGSFFDSPRVEDEAFQTFVRAHTAVVDYARFRAAGERRGACWRDWPAAMRDGVLGDSDVDLRVERYHLYVQWLADSQLRQLADRAGARGPGLFLDLPLGVHRDGYDVWRERSAFALNASAGAPPDAVFTKGQDWGFPPPHPEQNRVQGYRYMTAYLRHHLRRAGILRIDHVMSLHRLYWIPAGLESHQGLYVRYRAEEIYALLVLEAHRYSTILIGENLGTVPAKVNMAMARRGVHRMHVVQYELPVVIGVAPRPAGTDTVASLNTHDMPTFAAFWQGLDLNARRAAGLLDDVSLQQEQHNLAVMKRALRAYLEQSGRLRCEATDPLSVICACLVDLAASDARIVLVNVEDLWCETRPQNVPGTGDERANWRRKTSEPFEQWRERAAVVDVLREIARLRARNRSRP